MSDSCVPVLVVPKNEAHATQSHLKASGQLHKSFRSTPVGENGVAIPLRSEDITLLPESIRSRLVEGERSEKGPSVRIAFHSRLALAPVKSRNASNSAGIDAIRSYLMSNHNLTAEEVATVPSKWLKYGDILVLFVEANQRVLVPPHFLLEAFRLTDKKLRCAVLQRGAITGELRKPRVELFTPNESTETVHVENGVKFKFDVTKIMFAPGNGTERKRFGQMRISSNEVVVDMFAGLGYFTIPFLLANKAHITHFYTMEKNPDSYHYQVQNLELNGVDEHVTALCGDNRELGDQLKGGVDRIFMGYLPNTIDYVPRALQLAKRYRCVLHYHHLCRKEEFSTLAIKDIQNCLKSEDLMANVEVLAFSKVKSYAPQLFHCCADILLTNICPSAEAHKQ